MSSMLELPRKDLRALCAKLKQDHLLMDKVQKDENATHSSQLMRQKTFYYIHYTETIDAIKWKLHSTVQSVKTTLQNDAHPQGYVCPQCGRRYTPLEAISCQSPDGMSFLCDDCGASLIEDDTSEESKANQEKLRRLMDQLNPVIATLRKIDDTFIPENTFEDSLAVAVPAGTKSNVTQGYFPSSNLPYAQPSSNSNNNVSLQVSITSNAETVELEKKAEEEKLRLKEENALPAWHLESTVGKNMYDSGTNSISTSAAGNGIKEEAKMDIDSFGNSMGEASANAGNTNAESAVDEYFARLNAKQNQSSAEEEDEDDDDEEDDEFEDVTVPPVPTVAVQEQEQELDSDSD